MSPHTLTTSALTLAYADRVVASDITFDVVPGCITAVIGANGCGKSTLLRALARLLPPRSGTVLLNGTDIRRRKSRDVARMLGLLPQSPLAPEGITVTDLVARGRYPHQALFARSNAHDDAVVASSMAATGVAELADRSVDELSGGQKQRVWIAMALAQDTDILLLDEPTTFLDVAHQIEVLDLLADLNRTRGTTIVMVLHDMNLASRYADHLVAMSAGKIVAEGAPIDIMTERLISEVFDLDALIISDPISGTPLVLPRGRHHGGKTT